MSGVQKGVQRASGDAPADGAAARNAQWRGGAAGATGVVCAEQRLYSFSWKLLISEGAIDHRQRTIIIVENAAANCTVVSESAIGHRQRTIDIEDATANKGSTAI